MYKSMEVYDDKPHEECGVFGIFDRELSAVHETYYGILPCSTGARKAQALPFPTESPWKLSAAWVW